MIAAYADGYRVLKDDAYRQAAERAADFLLANSATPDGRLLRTYRAARPRFPPTSRTMPSWPTGCCGSTPPPATRRGWTRPEP